MLRTMLLAMGAAAGSAALAPMVLAQDAPPNPQATISGGGTPSPAELEAAKTFVAPKVGDYARKLAEQPDFMGSWTYTSHDPQVQFTIFDPANAVIPYRVAPGEQEFGPRPGTYIKNIPYKAEYQKKYDALVQETREGKSKDTFALCVPYGVPRMIGGAAGAMDIVQSPELVLVHNSYSRDERRIFLDGRKHPSPDGPEGTDGRTLSGHSVGHYEGDTLVVDTVNMLEGFYDETPAPFSNQIHLVERIRLIGRNLMEDQMTITDPVMLTGPWVVTRYFRRTAGPQASRGGVGGDDIVHAFHNLADRPCVPNVHLDDEGNQRMVLPQELEAQAQAQTKAKAANRAKAKERKR